MPQVFHVLDPFTDMQASIQFLRGGKVAFYKYVIVCFASLLANFPNFQHFEGLTRQYGITVLEFNFFVTEFLDIFFLIWASLLILELPPPPLKSYLINPKKFFVVVKMCYCSLFPLASIWN